jgi:hypothetical protein
VGHGNEKTTLPVWRRSYFVAQTDENSRSHDMAHVFLQEELQKNDGTAKEFQQSILEFHQPQQEAFVDGL